MVLREIGLSDGESKVYSALVKLSSSPVSKIQDETRLHRTAIYYFLKNLINKGLVNYIIRNKIRYYRATEPSKLLEYIKEKEDYVKQIIPSLNDLAKTKKQELRVEVYEGKQGVRTFMNDRLNFKGELLGFGIEDGKWKKEFPILMERYVKIAEKKGLIDKVLTKEKAFTYNSKMVKYKFIPKELFNPTPTMVYKNKVAIIIWEPLSLILIESKDLADSYKKYFEMLWMIAKRK